MTTQQSVNAALQGAQYDIEEEKKRVKDVKIGADGYKYAFGRAIKEFGRDGGTDLAAKLTYFMVLSLAPSLLAIFSILSLVLANNRDVVDDLVNDIVSRYVPSDYEALVVDVVDTMMDQAGGGSIVALVIGIATALWSASAYVKAFNRSANTVYGYAEGRGFVALTVSNLLTTLTQLVGIVVILISLALNRTLVESLLVPIAEPLGATGVANFLVDTFLPIWDWVRWPFILLLLVLMIATLYRATPNVQRPGRKIITVGAAFAIVGMAVGGVAMYIYLSNFASYGGYGAIGTVMALLFVLWVFNIVLLIGLEIDVELARVRLLRAGLPAEAELHLPPKAVEGVRKAAQARAKLEDEAYLLRANSGQGSTPSTPER
ncbi:MAG: YihY/virulence factor BrkB family protein [Micrococcus sp.]|nr:YihY/virulence factor BrkB family protein [Micrococcus sp.]